MIVMVASHDSARRGLFDAENAGGVGSGHMILIDHFNQLQSHLSHPGDTYRVYLLYFFVSQHCSGVSIDFLWVYRFIIKGRKMLELITRLSTSHH